MIRPLNSNGEFGERAGCYPVRNDLSKRSRKDVDVTIMSISAPLLRLFRENCGAEIEIFASLTSFRHLFGTSFRTGTSAHDEAQSLGLGRVC